LLAVRINSTASLSSNHHRQLAETTEAVATPSCECRKLAEAREAEVAALVGELKRIRKDFERYIDYWTFLGEFCL